VLRFVISELSVRFVVLAVFVRDNKCAIASLALPLNIETTSESDTDSTIVLNLTIVREAVSDTDIDSDKVLNID
jgi:hypothetical protein